MLRIALVCLILACVGCATPAHVHTTVYYERQDCTPDTAHYGGKVEVVYP